MKSIDRMVGFCCGLLMLWEGGLGAEEASRVTSAHYELNFQEKYFFGDIATTFDNIRFTAVFEGDWESYAMIPALRGSQRIGELAQGETRTLRIEYQGDSLGLFRSEEVIYDSWGRKLMHKVVNQLPDVPVSEKVYTFAYSECGDLETICVADEIAHERYCDEPSSLLDVLKGDFVIFSGGEVRLSTQPVDVKFVFEGGLSITLDLRQLDSEEKLLQQLGQKLPQYLTKDWSLMKYGDYSPFSQNQPPFLPDYRCDFKEYVGDFCLWLLEEGLRYLAKHGEEIIEICKSWVEEKKAEKEKKKEKKKQRKEKKREEKSKKDDETREMSTFFFKQNSRSSSLS